MQNSIQLSKAACNGKVSSSLVVIFSASGQRVGTASSKACMGDMFASSDKGAFTVMAIRRAGCKSFSLARGCMRRRQTLIFFHSVNILLLATSICRLLALVDDSLLVNEARTRRRRWDPFDTDHNLGFFHMLSLTTRHHVHLYAPARSPQRFSSLSVNPRARRRGQDPGGRRLG